VDEKFDPYHRWLGIPPNQQPPNHYRLLGLDPLENDPDVIESAADRQMAHLRTFQIGPYAHLSQKLLNEVAAAKVCLLNPEKKAAYDKFLGGKPKRVNKLVETEAIEKAGADEGTAIDIASLVGDVTTAKTVPYRGKVRPIRKRVSTISGPVIVVGLMLAAAIVIAVIAWVTRGPIDEKEIAKNSRVSESESGETHPAERKDVPAKPGVPGQPETEPTASATKASASNELPKQTPAEPSGRNPIEQSPTAKTEAHEEKSEDISPSQGYDTKEPSIGPAAKNESSKELHRTWKTRDGAAPIAADLEKVEQDTVVLKKPDGNSVRIPYEQLIESDQEDASTWVVSEATKIWNPEGSSLQTGRGAGNSQPVEHDKALSLNKALRDAFIKASLTLLDVSARQRGASGVKLSVQTAGGAKRNVILPVSESVALQITVPSRLVVDGKVSYEFGNCPLCDGLGKMKCPHCSRGKVSHMEPRTIRFPNGNQIVQQVQVYEPCSFCHGTGRLEACKHVYPGDWEPFGSRKLPDGAYSFLSASGGAHRVYIMLNDVRLRIYTSTKLLSFRREKGKIVTETEPLAKESAASWSKP